MSSVILAESEVTPIPTVPTIPTDNISSDPQKMLDELKNLNSEMQYPDDLTPPAVFAREPNSVDNYISLVSSWKEASHNSVINITPQNVHQTMSHVADRITVRHEQTFGVNSGISSAVNSRREYVDIYESDEETNNVDTYDLEEKIDATYNKLCSLALINAEAVDAAHKANGQLENINRHCVLAAKSNRGVEDKLQKLTNDVSEIKNSIVGLETTMMEIKKLLSAMQT